MEVNNLIKKQFYLKLYKKIFFKEKLFLPLLISLFFILLSQNNYLWVLTFGTFNVPPQQPAFSDFDSINNALKSYKDGYNIYLYNPYDLHGYPFVYPKTWLVIFEYLNLNNNLIFLIFCFFLIYIYYFVLIKLFSFSLKSFKIIFLLFFFSTTNLLLIERLNTDLIIFILLYYVITNKNLFIKNFCFLFSVSLKVFPFFAILVFIKKKIILTIILSCFLLSFISKDIFLGNKNMIEYTLTFAYGSRTFSNSLFKILNYNNFPISRENYYYLLLIIIFILLIFFSFFFFRGIKNNLKYSKNLSEFFIVGSSIYLGTFILGSNIDYRLIFLTFTFPILFKNFENISTKIFFISSFISFYSIWFQYKPGGYLFIITTLFIYLCKFYIFLFLSYKLGSALKNELILYKKKSLFF